MEEELVEVKPTSKKAVPNGFREAAKCFGIILITSHIIIIVLRIVELIISIINLINEYRLFYLLSIISFVIICFCTFFNFFYMQYEDVIILKIIQLTAIFGLYVLDGICYYLYYHEDINNIIILVFFILSDIAIFPLFTCCFVTRICNY